MSNNTNKKQCPECKEWFYDLKHHKCKKQNSFIRFGVSKELRKKIEEYAEFSNSTLSEFIRESIKDKIRSIEHPEQFVQSNNSQLNNAILEQIALDTRIIIKLEEQRNKRLEIAEDIENIRQRIKEEYESLREKNLISDFTEETKIIADLLNVHKSLTLEQISKKTDIDPENALLILNKDSRFKLNITTGRYEKR